MRKKTMAESAPQMEVVSILDKTTIVVGGAGVEGLRVGEEVVVLGVGRNLPGTNVPLVVPKETLEVTLVTPSYAIARPAQVTEQEHNFSTIAMSPRLVKRRPPLAVDEGAMTGNPAAIPIRPGDPVARPGDVSKYVERLADARVKK
jgi:hypothetical protein